MLQIERKETGNIRAREAACVVMALIVSGVVIGLCGYNPALMYREMLKGSFSSAYYFQQTIQKAIPLTIMGLGIAVCFKMGFFNVGAEGQFYIGVTAATYIALHTTGIPAGGTMALMYLSAFLAGGVWCLLAGAMKSRWGVSETLVTLMLNYIAMKLASYLQYVRWKDPGAFGFPKIANYPETLWLPHVAGVHAGWIIALVLTAMVWVLLHRMKLGYEIAVLGSSERTAFYAGMHTKRILLLASLIGGGICGLAGVIQATGVEHTMNDQMGGGMGYSAIVIAYMAHMEPTTILLTAFLFSVLLQGGAYMQVSMQIPSVASDVIQGIILLLILGGEFFSHYRIVRRHSRKEATR